MKAIRLNVSALWRSLRLLVAACACTLMLFSNAMPAYSLPNPFASDKPAQASDPTGGEANLLDIEKASQEVIYREEPNAPGQKEAQAKTNPGGLNAVQGTADIEEMKRPSNSQGETIEGILQDKLEEATGQK